MFIVEVIPISKQSFGDTLTYFTKDSFLPGTLVSVPLRKKEIYALVISTVPVSENKSVIKDLPYTLKKLSSFHRHEPIVSHAHIQAAHDTALFHATSLGAVIAAVTPKTILEHSTKVAVAKERDTPKDDRDTYGEPYIIQAALTDRRADYKSLIRESFARKQSVFLCVPTSEDARNCKDDMEKGIEEYTFVFDSTRTKKETLFLWNSALEIEHPVLIIGTPPFISIPRHDIGTIIIEKELSRAYKTLKRPFIDFRIFAERYAKHIGARLVYGDTLLRTETLHRFYNHEIIEYTPLKWRSLATASCICVDMRETQKNPNTRPYRHVIGDEALALLQETKENNGLSFVFSARRGLSPQVVCRDCGTVVRCTHCSTPVVLHGSAKNEHNFFLCHTCGDKRSAKETCTTCGSWNLLTLGIGTETVEKALKELIPDVTIFRLDHDTVTTHKKARKIVTDFYETAGSILLGTEMALPYLSDTIDTSVVASIDSLCALPDFRSGEKIMNSLLTMRERTRGTFMVQTRMPDIPLFEYALRGNSADFYRYEIAERERFHYPPFTTIVKVSYEGPREKVLAEMKHIKTFFEPHSVSIFPAFIESVRGKYCMHALIKVPKKEWPHKELIEKIRALPPSYTVKIDPDSLL